MENEGATTLSLKDLFYVLFKHKVTILVLFFSIIITILIGVDFLPEKYEASAALLIKHGRENLTTPAIPSSSQQQMLTMGLRKEDINSEIKIINNRSIIVKVVQKLGIDFLFPKTVKPETFLKIIKYELKQAIFKIKDFIYEILYTLDLKKQLSPFEMAVMGIESDLTVRQISNSDVIEVQLKWFSPDIAKEVVNTLLDFYLINHLEAHKPSGAYEFLKEHVERIENELKASEDKLHLLNKSQGITSYENQRKILLENIALFNASLKNTETEISETATKISELKKQLSIQTKTIQLTKEEKRNPVIDLLKSKLLELELEKKKIDKKFTENTRPVNSINEEIQKVKDKLEEEVANVVGAITTGINMVYEETEKELLRQEVSLSGLNERRKMLEEHIRSYLVELERLNKYVVELNRFNRQIQINEENYKLHQKKFEEARISNVLDKEKMVSIKVIEPGLASFTPVSPRKLLIIAVGVVLSLIIGIGFPFLLEYLDHSIKTEKDVKTYFNLPFLGSIKEVKH